MRKKTITALLVLMFVLLGYFLGLVTAWVIISGPSISIGAINRNANSPTRQMPLFWEAWNHVQTDFIGPLPDARAITYGAIRGALATLNDPYTVFIEPQAHQRETEDLQGKFGGIGVTMRRDEAGHVLLSPMPDAPAISAGVQEGDILEVAAGKPITPAVSFDDIAALVRGPVGSSVEIIIQRGNPPITHTFTIVRQEIQTPSVAWHLVDGHPDIGYIALSRFTGRSKDELVNAIQALRGQGATRLILDLRDNGGGLRESGIEVASQFLSGGVVMYEQQKNKPEETFAVLSGGVAMDMPLVVLVNQGTASASEIVAGALQDRERAKLVGETTYGKGSVQHIYDLSDGASVHVTSAEWFTPNHRQLTGHGLTPDIAAARTQDDINAGHDPQLDAAIEALIGNK